MKTGAATARPLSLEAVWRRVPTGAIARGSAYGLIIRMAAMVVLILQMVLAARFLGPEAYGALSLAAAQAALIGFAATLGLDQFSAFELGRVRGDTHPEAVRRYRKRVLTTGLAISLGLGASLFAMAQIWPFQTEKGQFALMASSLAAPAVTLILLARGFAQGTGRVAIAQMPLDLLRPLFFVIGLCGIWVAYGAVGIQGALAAFVLASAMAAGAGLVFGMRLPLSMKESHGDGEPKIDFRKSFGFYGASFTLIATGELFILLMVGLAGFAETGLYAIVFRIGVAMMIGAAAISFALSPRISTYVAKGDLSGLKSVTAKATLAGVLATGVVGLGVLLFGEGFMSIFGADFAPAYPLLLIMAGAQLFVVAGGPVMQLLSMSGRPHLVAGIRMSGLAVGAISALWLMPTYGALGGVIAYCGCLTIQMLVAYFWVRRFLSFDPSLLSAGRAFRDA